ncbi:hypothetical protein B9G53_00075 [Pseudanabaena sp. SR411]|uniref:hypothetical protein n=1 Tax=Pseudanabaena sp. SR411 TaxID=1980935 RepID=UPI000BD1A778|nr:hypothetical protein [Pseudanabaena sp. SR411]OYQ68377.1 hypothetical protein B9G53_00075 [Pseudanabaena sp. SR411]
MKSNNKNYNNRKWKLLGLYALFGIDFITFIIVIIALVPYFLDSNLLVSQPVTQGEWNYSKLIEEVRKKPAGISRITLSPDRSFAEVTVLGGSEGQKKVRVNLPNDPEFAKTIRENNIDLDVAFRPTERSLVQTLSMLLLPILPVLLLVSLFFLLSLIVFIVLVR